MWLLHRCPLVRRWHMALALSLLLLTSQGCGYALAGHGSFLPSYIRQIGIPPFANQTSYFDIAQILTDKVQREFIGRGNYKIVPETTGADAVLVEQVLDVAERVEESGHRGARVSGSLQERASSHGRR